MSTLKRLRAVAKSQNFRSLNSREKEEKDDLTVSQNDHLSKGCGNAPQFVEFEAGNLVQTLPVSLDWLPHLLDLGEMKAKGVCRVEDA
jgi:hypothetical protein